MEFGTTINIEGVHLFGRFEDNSLYIKVTTNNFDSEKLDELIHELQTIKNKFYNE